MTWIIKRKTHMRNLKIIKLFMYFYILTNISTQLQNVSFHHFTLIQAGKIILSISILHDQAQYLFYIYFLAHFFFIFSNTMETNLGIKLWQKDFSEDKTWNTVTFLDDILFNTWNWWVTRCPLSGKGWHPTRWAVIGVLTHVCRNRKEKFCQIP